MLKGGSALDQVTEQQECHVPQLLYSVCLQTLSIKNKTHQVYGHINEKSFFNSTFAFIMRYKSNLSCNHERKIKRNKDQK